MKFNLILLILLFLSSQIKGQHYLPIQQDSILNFSIQKKGVNANKKRKNEFILTGIADYSGTSLGKDIAQKFFYGGEISNSMKSKSLNRHRAINRFGSDTQAEFEYRNFQVNLLKIENWGFVLKAGVYNFLQAIYSKDFFTFPMYGNSEFSGDTAKFSGSRFSNVTYQKIGFGWLNKKTKSSVSLNLFGLNNATSLSIEEGEIYQNATLDSLSFNYNGIASFSNGNIFLKGIGVGIDADLRWQSKSLKGKPSFQFLVRNIGFITQTTNFINYYADTSFSYTGFSYNQLTNGATFQSKNFAILDTLGISKSERETTFLLPGMFQISKLIDQSEGAKLKKFQEFYGARLYLSYMAIPMVFGGIDYNPFNGLIHLGASLSYGGYAKLRGGFYSSVKWNNYSLGISSENLFNPTGQSIIFRLQCVF
jgi:hypothetical protein